MITLTIMTAAILVGAHWPEIVMLLDYYRSNT